MNGLAKHLEVLLLNNDCVAVPDFGGFVAHYVAARVDEADGLFLPPKRTIGFNPQLKMNDSLLAQSYVEAYDISYPEALLRIEQDVEEIRNSILYEGQCFLEGIGTLFSNDEGTYSFDPYEAGLLTPSLYGLGSLDFNMLGMVQTTTPVKPAVETVIAPLAEPEEEVKENNEPSLLELIDDDDDQDSAIHIKMSWIRNTVAAAAAIVLFFLLTTPVANSNLNSQTMSALQNSIMKRLIPQDSNIVPATPVVQKETIENGIANVDSTKQELDQDEKKTARKEETEKPASPTMANNDNPYCLVLASQVKKSNAELFVGKMRDRGFKDTEINIHNGVVRVVYGHFKSQNDAYIELHKLRFEEDFDEAWVYKRKSEG